MIQAKIRGFANSMTVLEGKIALREVARCGQCTLTSTAQKSGGVVPISFWDAFHHQSRLAAE